VELAAAFMPLSASAADSGLCVLSDVEAWSGARSAADGDAKSDAEAKAGTVEPSLRRFLFVSSTLRGALGSSSFRVRLSQSTWRSGRALGPLLRPLFSQIIVAILPFLSSASVLLKYFLDSTAR
jgi:hypothetical protein